MARSPDQILADFDAGCQGTADIDMRSVLWEVINDVCTSYELALLPMLGDDMTGEVNNTVYDYLVNHYGDEV